MNVCSKYAFYFLCCLGLTRVSAQNLPIHKDLQYFYSDYYGLLDSTFSSERNTAPFLSLDSSYLSLCSDIKYKNLNKWYWERLLNKSLITMSDDDYAITLDPYYNLQVGAETTINNKAWFNKKGVVMSGRFGKKIKIHSYFTENVVQPESYVSNFVNYSGIMPGDAEVKFKQNYYTFMFAAGGLSYQVNKYIDLAFGHGKNFIGDGYRSILLSDAAAAYPYGRFNLHFGKRVNYTTIVAEFLEKTPSTPGNNNTLRRKKYGSFHYLDVKIHRKLFVGIFEAVMWGSDSTARSSFDLNYLNPFVIIRPLEFQLGSKDKMFIGTNVKYLPTKYTSFYGQFLFTEYYEKELFGGKNWWGNKYAFQIGGKFHNFPFAKNLFLQVEYNQIRPFTYAHYQSITSYSHLGQPLAHPSGSNLKEAIFIANYRVKRWSVNFKSIYRISGLEKSDSTSIGTEVQRSYDLRESEYGNVIGQGIPYTQWYNTFAASYLLNPSNMLFLEAGISNRMEKIDGSAIQHNYIFVGMRTGLLNNYYDF